MAKDKKKEPSIRFHFDGEFNTDELHALFVQALVELEETPNQIYKNCNFYVTPATKQNAKLSTTTHVIKEPYPCAADEHEA